MNITQNSTIIGDQEMQTKWEETIDSRKSSEANQSVSPGSPSLTQRLEDIQNFTKVPYKTKCKRRMQKSHGPPVAPYQIKKNQRLSRFYGYK